MKGDLQGLSRTVFPIRLGEMIAVFGEAMRWIFFTHALSFSPLTSVAMYM
ncbi:hypothetical protein QUF80_14230 [Desulfococcaceae bacterium HSG8]|nr:hypothetical protein [Desulfococcaceae bacterium HSG8]